MQLVLVSAWRRFVWFCCFSEPGAEAQLISSLTKALSLWSKDQGFVPKILCQPEPHCPEDLMIKGTDVQGGRRQVSQVLKEASLNEKARRKCHMKETKFVSSYTPKMELVFRKTMAVTMCTLTSLPGLHTGYCSNASAPGSCPIVPSSHIQHFIVSHCTLTSHRPEQH